MAELTREGRMERAICRQVIRDLLKAGYHVSIDNGGEEYEVEFSTNFTELAENIHLSDEDYLVVYKCDSESVRAYHCDGWVRLVYGNAPSEVICDYTINLDSVLQKSIAKADAAAEKGL